MELKSYGYYAEIFGSEECPNCSETKKIKMWFCYDCFCLLPKKHKAAVYRRLGKGGRRAYEAAMEWLSNYEAAVDDFKKGVKQ